MLNKIIRFSLNNRYLIISVFALIVSAGLYTVSNTTVDVSLI